MCALRLITPVEATNTGSGLNREGGARRFEVAGVDMRGALNGHILSFPLASSGALSPPPLPRRGHLGETQHANDFCRLVGGVYYAGNLISD